MKRSDIVYTISKILIDALMIFGALWCVYLFRMHYYELFSLDPPTPFPPQEFVESAFNITLFLLVIIGVQGRYKFGTDTKVLDEFNYIFWSFSSSLGILIITFFFLQKFFFSRFVFLAFWITGICALILGRIFLRLLHSIVIQMGYGQTNVLVIGTQTIALMVIQTLQKRKRYHIVGTLSENTQMKSNLCRIKSIGTIHQFESVLQKYHIDEIIVAMNNSTQSINPEWVRIAHIKGIEFRYVPDELGIDLSLVSQSTLGTIPVTTLRNTRIEGWGSIVKQTFDFCCSFLLLILLSPILLITAFLVWRENPRVSCIYKSERVGKNGKKFICYKFRSMIPNAEKLKKNLLEKNERKDGVLFKIKNDPRITPLGKFLRTTSIDELPQIFNVLKGDMSLIGPRPHLPGEIDKYGKNDLRVLCIKPGITGFSQINGRSALTFQEEMEYELFYVKNWSLWLDLIIFFKSIIVVLKRRNAS